MADDNGWIKLHRKMLDEYIWTHSTPEQKVILITLIAMANHEPNRRVWNGEVFFVERGQLVTSLESICEKCGKGISTQNVRTALTRFEKLGFLTNKSTKSGRIITILNWEQHQGNKIVGDKAKHILNEEEITWVKPHTL
jgi:DNA replication protein DnaD